MGISIIKVYASGCPICDTMSRFDKSVVEGFPGVSFKEILFDDIQNYGRDPYLMVLYRYLENYAVSATYEIDFPTYLVLSESGNYLGHVQGGYEISGFRSRVKEILNEHSE
jgi:hypothetical protein